MKTSPLALGILASVLSAGLAGAFPAGLAEAKPRPLFGEIPGQAGAGRPQAVRAVGKPPTEIRGRRVRVDVSSLAGVGERAVGLNLFPDVELDAVKRRFERRGERKSTWIGQAEGDPASSVIIVEEDGLVVGSVFAHGKHYAIRGSDADSQEVVEIDQSAFQPEACDQAPPASTGGQAQDLTTLPVPAAAQADTGATIDVLVVYTPAALAQRGGNPTTMTALGQLAVAQTNQSYANSDIGTRLNLVHVAPVSYTETNYVDDLARLQGTTDPYLDSVHDLRDTHHADVVVMLVDALRPGYNGVCGYGNINTFAAGENSQAQAFALVSEACATDTYSFGHEIGHLQGARHDLYVDSIDGPVYQKNHGHTNPADRMRTMMAYEKRCTDASTTCPRVLYWSSPSVLYPGTATATSSVKYGENNAAVLNGTAPAVANFRQSTLTLTVRSAYPAEGVDVSVSPADRDGLGDGTTPFARTYPSGATVTLTAPVAAQDPRCVDPFPFKDWSGCTPVDGHPGQCTVAVGGERTVTANYDPGNYPPMLNAISDRTVNEDAAEQTVSLGGISAGTGESSQHLSFVVSSSNQGLIPDDPDLPEDPDLLYVVYTGGPTGSLKFKPIANASGTAEITVTATDDGGGCLGSVIRTFTVTVKAVNDPPTLDAISDVHLSKNAGTQVVPLVGLSPGPGESQALTLTATSSNTGLVPHPAVNDDGPIDTWSLSFTPKSNAYGSATITVRVSDGLATLTRSFRVIVNEPPTIDPVADVVIDEDAGARWISLSGITAGVGEKQTLRVKAASSNTALIPTPTVSYASPAETGSLKYTPVANQPGVSPSDTATIRVTVSDGLEETFVEFTVTVNAVNDPPTLNAVSNRTINEDVLEQKVSLAGITPGPKEAQDLRVTAVSANPAVIPNPTVIHAAGATTGSLSFAPLPDAFGSAMITVTVDDGQPERNTAVRAFLVTVKAVNDQPTLAGLAWGGQDVDENNPVVIDEDADIQTVTFTGVSPGGGESQKLTVTASSSNTGLIPTPQVNYVNLATAGTLSLKPAANRSGTATISVKVSDSQSSNATVTRKFRVTVNPVNDPPTINGIADRVVKKNVGTQTVSLSGITAGPKESQKLTVTASSSDPALIPDPAVSYTSANTAGSLKFKPVTGAYGTATITVTVADGLASTQGSFDITVNDPPTLDDPPDLTINEDASEQTVTLAGVAAGSGETQPLTVTATSSKTVLVPDPTVTYDGASGTWLLRFTPVPDASGSATVTVRVDDGQAGNNTVTRSFVVTVKSVNDLPVFDLDLPTVDGQHFIQVPEGSGQQAVGILNVSAGPGEKQALTISAVSSDTSVVSNVSVSYTSPNATGTVRFTPVANNIGNWAVVTVKVKDSGPAPNFREKAFRVNITAVTEGDAPAAPVEAPLGGSVVHLVSTSAGLQAALEAAAANAADDVIRLAGGTYTLSGNGTAHFAYSSTEVEDLVIEGGWTGDFSRRDPGAASEVRNDVPVAVDGDGGVLGIAAGGGVTLDGLTISGGSASGNGGGLAVTAGGLIVVRNCTVVDNYAAGGGGGLFLESTGGSVWLHGSLVGRNGATAGGGGLITAASAAVFTNEVSGNAASAADGGLRISIAAGGDLLVSNNTIHGNHATAGASGLTVGASGAEGVAVLHVRNNIVYGNTTAPNLVVAGDCTSAEGRLDLRIVNNDLENCSLCPDHPLDGSNVSVDFSGRAAGDIRLSASDAVLIDGGARSAAPPVDIEGEALPLDGDGDGDAVPDIGADEYNPSSGR